MNSCAKLFTGLLTTRLSSWAEEANLIPEIQSAFRKGRSCADNIFVFTHVLSNRLRSPGGRLYSAYIDFKQAFDSINQARLWMKMTHAGVSSGFIQ